MHCISCLFTSFLFSSVCSASPGLCPSSLVSAILYLEKSSCKIMVVVETQNGGQRTVGLNSAVQFFHGTAFHTQVGGRLKVRLI